MSNRLSVSVCVCMNKLMNKVVGGRGREGRKGKGGEGGKGRSERGKEGR